MTNLADPLYKELFEKAFAEFVGPAEPLVQVLTYEPLVMHDHWYREYQPLAAENTSFTLTFNNRQAKFTIL